MLGTTTAVVLTGITTAGANLLDHKSVSPRQLIGLGLYAIIMAAFNEGNEKLAGQFAMIVLVGTFMLHLPKLVKGLGLDK